MVLSLSDIIVSYTVHVQYLQCSENSLFFCYYRIESALQMNENAHNISVRWTTSSQEYVDTKAVSLHRGKQELKKRINKDTRERWILLRLKLVSVFIYNEYLKVPKQGGNYV